MYTRFTHLYLVGAFALALFALAFDEAIAADTERLFDVVSLSADAHAEIPNDLMDAVLVVQAEHTDAAELAIRINADMAWAVDRMVSDFPSIEMETLDYQTWPRYERERGQNRIVGWEASQRLKLQTSDFEAGAQAMAALQERLTVQGMNMSTRRDTRRTAENTLISEALQAFEQRAEVVRAHYNANGYRTLDLNIQTEGAGQYPIAYNSRAASAEMADAAPVSLQAGNSEVRVRIDGQIQLER